MCNFQGSVGAENSAELSQLYHPKSIRQVEVRNTIFAGFCGLWLGSHVTKNEHPEKKDNRHTTLTTSKHSFCQLACLKTHQIERTEDTTLKLRNTTKIGKGCRQPTWEWMASSHRNVEIAKSGPNRNFRQHIVKSICSERQHRETERERERLILPSPICSLTRWLVTLRHLKFSQLSCRMQWLMGLLAECFGWMLFQTQPSCLRLTKITKQRTGIMDIVIDSLKGYRWQCSHASRLGFQAMMVAETHDKVLAFGGWQRVGAQHGIWKCPFQPEKHWEILKIPWFLNQEISGIFHGTTSTKNARKMPENALKIPENFWKTLDSKIRMFSNPPFYAPTLCHPLKHELWPWGGPSNLYSEVPSGCSTSFCSNEWLFSSMRNLQTSSLTSWGGFARAIDFPHHVVVLAAGALLSCANFLFPLEIPRNPPPIPTRPPRLSHLREGLISVHFGPVLAPFGKSLALHKGSACAVCFGSVLGVRFGSVGEGLLPKFFKFMLFYQYWCLLTWNRSPTCLPSSPRLLTMTRSEHAIVIRATCSPCHVRLGQAKLFQASAESAYAWDHVGPVWNAKTASKPEMGETFKTKWKSAGEKIAK